MPLKFSHIWQGTDEIPLFKWLYHPKLDTAHSVIHVYSMFMNRPADAQIWRVGKRVFYSGEYIMDEQHANVVVRFMPSDDNTNPRHILKMPAPHKLSISNNNRQGVKYIQLRLQELDAVEWKIKGLLQSGNLALQQAGNSGDSFSQIREYLLDTVNITPYADMMLSWQRNRADIGSNNVGLKSGRKFCLFMVSNPNCKLRNDTFMLLSRVGHVVSAGGFRNNLAPGDSRPPNRMNHTEYINYLRQFRFMITFENHSLPGYHTEKITNAFEAGVIPIYWGDPMITETYDARSFIHIPTLDNPNHQWEAVKQAVTRVQEAERDSQIYASYFRYPPMNTEVCQREDARVAASLLEIHNELQ